MKSRSITSYIGWGEVRRLTAILLFSCTLSSAPRQTQQAAPAAPSSPTAPAGDATNAAAESLEPFLKQFVDTLAVVNTQAADPAPIDKVLYEGAIPAMLRELDPHTQFFDPQQFEQLKQMERSEQKGFGSIVSVLPGQVIFLQTLPGTPSNRAGIMPGDQLLAVNNIAIGQLEPEQIVGLLSQARQQTVMIYVRRQGSQRPLAFTLTPALVDAPTVDRAFLLRPGYAYIRVTSWDMQTSQQLTEALTKVGADKLEGLVLDLRNNPGGVVKAALDAAAMFLKPGERILTARGRFGQPETADVPKNASPYHFRMAVIINGKTASASEILTGALQDHDRAVIVGEPSYGKGLVQSVLPLSNNTGLALTTAFYYTPSGRSIQKPLQNSQLSQTFAARTDAPKPTFKTDHGRTVMGGGGIQPDIQVSPQERSRLEIVLDASGALTAYATQFLSTHSPLPSKFEITPDLLDEFKVFLSMRGIQPNVSEWSRERTWISNRLKQEIVTLAAGVAAGDEIEMQQDPQVQQALRSVQKQTIAELSATDHQRP